MVDEKDETKELKAATSAEVRKHAMAKEQQELQAQREKHEARLAELTERQRELERELESVQQEIAALQGVKLQRVDAGAATEEEPVETEILSALREAGEPLTANAVINAVSIHGQKVGQVLNRMVEAGRVSRVGDKYAPILKPPHPDAR
jgi:septal ring factor EnvC (AmiA/AmiB activator)